jgi:hypothetical protein
MLHRHGATLDAESHALSANKKKVFLSNEPIMTLVKNNMDLFLVVGSHSHPFSLQLLHVPL